MLLKRNVFRIVCALFYLPVALLSMFEIINLVMTNSQNRYFLVGGVVFGVLLFLIAAYFIKQKKWLIIAENSRPISIILETIIVVLVGVGLFLWQNLVYGWKTAATSLVLTLCIYAIGRLCSGRICGIISFASSIYLVIYLNQAQYLQEQMTLNMFSFLIPYLCFLIWLKALRFGEKTSVFSCVFGALFLGVVFAFAVRINPLVTVLFLGCFLALFFAGQKNPNPSIFSKGSLSILINTTTISVLPPHSYSGYIRLLLYLPTFPSPVGADVNHISTYFVVGEMPQCVFGIAVHLLYMFGQRRIRC